ncbi:MAG: hypothetical protein KF795_04925 [Labilithrix sp.]|nr:hypothetical protein [Labilithrix sp.]
MSPHYVVAVMALGRSVDEEAPRLAADLGLTAYETAVMLRAPAPVIVLRSEDRARAADVLGKLRARGHDAIACELDAVVSSDDMFRPKAFRFERGDFVGLGQGEERRLPLADIFALVRANHVTRTEDTVVDRQRQISLGRAALTGGLLTTKAKTTETTRVTNEREAVLYVFRSDAAPWLLASTQMRYDGLAANMKVSRIQNFEVLIGALREMAPSAAFDARLLAVRASSTVVAASPTHFSTSSSGALDVLAHIVAMSLGRAANPYR